MVSAYGEGARFERHCDNHCVDGEDCANRRILSAVLYLVSPTWSRDDGGALRIFRPAVAHSEAGDPSEDAVDALVDVVPQPSRLVLFMSDQRVPHEVLPVSSRDSVRHAIALWFLRPPAMPEEPAEEPAGSEAYEMQP